MLQRKQIESHRKACSAQSWNRTSISFVGTVIIVLSFTTLVMIVAISLLGGWSGGEEYLVDCREIGSIETDDLAYDVAMEGDYIYLAEGEEGLSIFNITDSRQPRYVGRDDVSHSIISVELNGSYAHLTMQDRGYRIVNITDKENPTVVGSILSNQYARDVTVDGVYAYVSELYDGFTIVNISDPSHPVREGRYETSFSRVDAVSVRGDYAYVADYNEGFLVIDITNKSDPKRLWEYDPSGNFHAMDVHLIGNYAYVSEQYHLSIFSLDNATNPTLVCNISGRSVTPAVDGNLLYIYADDWPCILNMYDIGNISNPEQIAHNTYSVGWSGGIAVRYPIFYGASGDAGLRIIEMAPYAWIDRVLPNPSLETDNVTFEGHAKSLEPIIQYAWRGEHHGEFYNGTLNITATSVLSGNQTIYFKALNSIGVWSDEAKLELIFHEKPVAYIGKIDPNPALDAESIRFEGNGTDDGSIERYSWRSSIIGEFYNGTAEKFMKKLPSGIHGIYFKVLDDNGVWSDEVSTFLSVRGKPKIVGLSISTEPYFAGQSIRFFCNASDDGTIEEYRWESAADGVFYSGLDAVFDYSGLSVGSHHITVTVRDNDSCWSEEEAIEITVLARPIATIDSITPASVLAGENVTFAARGSDEDGDVVAYSWRSALDGVLYNGTNASFTCGNLSIGDHTIYLKAMDDDGFWSDEVSAALVVRDPDAPNTPPTIIVTSPSNHSTATGTVTIEGTAADADGSDSIVSVQVSVGDGAWQNITGTTFWSFRWDSTAVENGEHSLRFRAFDGANHSDEAVLVLDVQNDGVANIPPTVSFTSHENGSVVSGVVIIAGTASDPDGDETIVKVEMNLDNGDWFEITFSSGTGTWQYEWNATDLGNRYYVFKVRAFDGADHSDIRALRLSLRNTDTGGDGDDDDGIEIAGMNGFMLLGGAGALVALVAAALMIGRSRKRKENEKPPGTGGMVQPHSGGTDAPPPFQQPARPGAQKPD